MNRSELVFISQPDRNSPPSKRLRNLEPPDFMESTLEDLDDSRTSLEEPGFKHIEQVNLKIAFHLNFTAL